MSSSSSDPSMNRSAASGYDYPAAPFAILAALLAALSDTKGEKA